MWFCLLFSEYIPKSRIIEYPAYIKKSNATVYKGPGKNYNIVGNIPAILAPIKVMAESDVWCKIVDCNGVVGWVQQIHIGTKYQRAVVLEDVDMHKRSNASSRHIATLKKHSTVEIKKSYGDFVFVKAYQNRKSIKGWINKSKIWPSS